MWGQNLLNDEKFKRMTIKAGDCSLNRRGN